MKLPNGHLAVVDIAKPRDYCLNPDHEDGKHKARVFTSALGLIRGDAHWLCERLLKAAASEPAILVSETRFGRLYMIEFRVSTASHSAVIRSGWIVRYSEEFRRLVTCYVKPRSV